MRRYVPGITPDRRKRKEDDLWGKILRWLGVASWVLMFSFLAIANKTEPETQEALEKAASGAAGSALTRYIFFLMIMGLAISISGFFIIKKRNRRATDEFVYSVLVLGLVSICGIIYYLFLM